MQEEMINARKLMDMANKFSGYRIDPKYFPLMFESPFILEALNHIYILRRNRKLNSDDTQEIKQVFQENFRFFKKLYSKKYLILSVVFFTLLLFSGAGCVYLPIIFVPLVFIFCVCLIVCSCLINIKSRPLNISEMRDSCKHELFELKRSLDQLKNSLVDKYQVRAAHVDNIDTSVVVNQAGNSQKKKKSVSFAPKLNELNMFFIESHETRSRANSYESNGNLQPKA